MQTIERKFAVLLAPLLWLSFIAAGQAQNMLAITGATIETVGKEGTIESGTLLIKNGKIEAVGKDVEIPVAAKRIDAAGKTVLPGIVDPYFVVSIPRNTPPAAAPRTIVFGGRTFIIGGGGPPPIATTFAKVADGIDIDSVNWKRPLRSGITTLHVVTSGYAQSLFAKNGQEQAVIKSPEGKLTLTASTSTKALDVLRNGLKEDKKTTPSAAPPRGPSPEQLAALRARFGDRFRLPPSASSRRPSSTSSASASTKEKTPLDKLWDSVKSGSSPVFVNVNNAAAVLHVGKILKESPKTKVALIADGTDTQLAMDSIDPKTYTLVLPPSIDLIPNSRLRVNVSKMLAEKKVEFAYSLTLGQSDFRAQQDVPLFPIAMLVRGGVERQQALRALTLNPAKLLGLDKEIGTLEKGKQADFIICDGDPFAATTGIEKVFVEGKLCHER